MNKWIGIGRLTKDPETRYTQGEDSVAITRYTLAVDRKFKNEGEQQADFVPIVAFGKAGEFAEKYFRKGMKVTVAGRIQTGSYTNNEGVKIYTTDIIAEEQEFCESKSSRDERDAAALSASGYKTDSDGFMNVPEGIDEDLPFASPSGR